MSPTVYCILTSRISQKRCVLGTKLPKTIRRASSTPTVSKHMTYAWIAIRSWLFRVLSCSWLFDGVHRNRGCGTRSIAGTDILCRLMTIIYCVHSSFLVYQASNNNWIRVRFDVVRFRFIVIRLSIRRQISSTGNRTVSNRIRIVVINSWT